MPLRHKDLLERKKPKALLPLDPREKKAIESFRRAGNLARRLYELNPLKRIQLRLGPGKSFIERNFTRVEHEPDPH